ncbi:MAG: hypothetical protein K0U20_08005 [Proteobacteria bacterium]|nr:hypothetical protein [Pseudomonadota bacterium]
MTKTTSSSTLNQEAAAHEAHQEAVAQTRLQQLRGVVLSVLSSPVRLATYVGSALMGALTGLMNMFKPAPSSPTDDVVDELLDLGVPSGLPEAEPIEAAEEAAVASAIAASLAAKEAEDAVKEAKEAATALALVASLAAKEAEDAVKEAKEAEEALALVASLEDEEAEEALALVASLEDEDAATALAIAASLAAKEAEDALALEQAEDLCDAFTLASELAPADSSELGDDTAADYDGDDESDSEIEAEVPNNTVARVAAVAGTAALAGLAAYTVFGAEDGPAGVIRAIPGYVAGDAVEGVARGAEALRQDAQVLLDTTVVPYASTGLKNAALLLGTLGDVAVGGLSSSLIGLGAIYGVTASAMSATAGHIGDAAVLLGNKVQADATSLATQLSNAFFPDVGAVGDALNDIAKKNLALGG